MSKFIKTAAIGIAASTMIVAVPASASIFEYQMTNGDLLTINTDTQTGTWVGDSIDTTFTSPDFADFTGGANPSFTTDLASLDGTRIIRGQTVTDNDSTHQQKLIFNGSSVNLWSHWGDPITGGDYVRSISEFAEVPAPGMLGLLGLALVALGFGRRRRKKAAAAAA